MPRELDRGDGFEKRIQRAAEQPGLLSGHDRHGTAIAEDAGGMTRLHGRAARFKLTRHDVRQSRAIVRRALHPRDRLAPTRVVCRVAGEE